MCQKKAKATGEGPWPQLGARPIDPKHSEFRVWAPGHGSVEVIIEGTPHSLFEGPNDTFEAILPASSGDRYLFRIDGAGVYPDPCSRFQPDGVQGPSELIDPAKLLSDPGDWRPPSLDELVIYELHVGTYSATGTFRGIIERLGQLHALGIRAIELMPVATFPGQRGWGYDGLYTYAPHPSYGRPEELCELIVAAHATGLAVIMDVVYNHLGPGSENITAFGPYFTERVETLWGSALDYSQRAVREWAIQNAEQWVRDYGVDGLRIDAAHSVFDRSRIHVLEELAMRVHATNPEALVISEMETGDLRPIEQWGHDAQWADELHHAVHVLLTGEHEGYYENYGKVSDIAKALQREERDRLVVCAQNHDQVGNRAFGDRLHGDRLRLAAFCTILSPGTPLLFMGEEYDEQHPFQFFTDHIDPTIAEATQTGRRKEFERFSAFGGTDIPDPQSETTFHASKLSPENPDPNTLEYYGELLRIRTKLKGLPIMTTVDEERKLLRVRRGPYELVMNFSATPVEGIPPYTGLVRP